MMTMNLINVVKLFLSCCCWLATTAQTTHAAAAAASCVSGNFYLTANGASACNYTTLLTAFTKFYKDPINVPTNGPCSGVSAETALWQLLPATDATTAKSKVDSICAKAFASYSKDVVTFDQIVQSSSSSVGSQTTNFNFVKNFFAGRTDWNEQYETLYGSTPPTSEDTNYTHINKDDAAVIDTQYNGAGQYGKIIFPENLPQFSNCQVNSVYCCWTADRQPNDGNGNCKYPTDSECVDADPADNTNLCLVQHAAGSSSTTWKSNTGLFIFSGDDAEGEGPSHCHGYAWDENPNDPTNVYRGNSLFYISMYDHLYARGYVRNVPGAPMCACAEQMPVVSRADCTQMTALQNFKFTYQSGSLFTAEVTNIDISYGQCKGYDRTGKEMNNDLWAHYNRLFYEGRVSANKFRTFSQHVLIQDLCRHYEKLNMASSSGLTVGYNVDTSVWYQVAGREAATLPYVIGKSLFDLLFSSSTNQIIRRTCPGCSPTHQNLFYRRISPVPQELDLLTALLSQHEPMDGQEYGKDFLIYPTYNDALHKVNAWACNYTASWGFPGNCGPTYNGMYEDQSSSFDWGGGRADVAFYVQTSPISKSLIKRPTVHIGREWMYGKQSYSGVAFVLSGKNYIYMTGVGTDIWSDADSFDYSATPAKNKNLTAIVKVHSFSSDQGWAKTGLDIRATTTTSGAGSIHFGAFLINHNGAGAIWRVETDSYTYIEGYQENVTLSTVFLKVQKMGNTFTASMSTDEAVTWTNLHDDPVTIPNFPTSYYVGLAVTPSWSNRPAESIFSNYTVK